MIEELRNTHKSPRGSIKGGVEIRTQHRPELKIQSEHKDATHISPLVKTRKMGIIRLWRNKIAVLSGRDTRMEPQGC